VVQPTCVRGGGKPARARQAITWTWPGWWAGEVAAVQAAASRIRLARGAGEAGDIDDALTIMLELRLPGALATVIVAWTRPGPAGHLRHGQFLASEATPQARARPGLHPLRREPGPAGHPAARPPHPFEGSVRPPSWSRSATRDPGRRGVYAGLTQPPRSRWRPRPSGRCRPSRGHPGRDPLNCVYSLKRGLRAGPGPTAGRRSPGRTGR